MSYPNHRRPCRLGHFDCIGANAKDDRCWMDPTRCENPGRHQYDWNRETDQDECVRCGKVAAR